MLLEAKYWRKAFDVIMNIGFLYSSAILRIVLQYFFRLSDFAGIAVARGPKLLTTIPSCYSTLLNIVDFPCNRRNRPNPIRLR